LLAGLFEETARYILFKFILKKNQTWNESVYVGLGHGGTEKIIFGALAALAFINMLAYRYVDLSTAPSIPPEQLELAKQQGKSMRTWQHLHTWRFLELWNASSPSVCMYHCL